MNNIRNIKDIINFSAEEYGENIAFRYKVSKDVIEDKSYIDLKRDSESFSRVLNNLEVIGKHIAVIGATSYEWIVSYFGIVNSNSVVVPIDAQLPAEDVCDLLERADVEVLIFSNIREDVAKMAKEKCKKIKYLISMQLQESNEFALSFNELLDKNKGDFSIDIDREKLCAILFTSGTTGKSKGVMLNHRNISDNVIYSDMKIKAGTVSMTVLPIHHSYCFSMDILKGVSLGLCICINDSIMRVQKNMKLFKPEVMCLVPMIIESFYNKLSDATGLKPKKLVAKAALGGNLKYIYSGGAYLNQELIDGFEKYGITILQGYGMTECSPVISTNYPLEKKKDSVGKLLSNCEAKIVNEEIWVKGSSVMMGYYKMPKETEETLENGWLKTGDLGYIDDDNFILITGRKKNLIILSNGENISPEELENELNKNRIVKEVLVSGEDNLIKAEVFPDLEYVEKKKIKDVKGELQKIVDTINSNVPAYKRISKLIIRDIEFEKTTSKKIKRKY